MAETLVFQFFYPWPPQYVAQSKEPHIIKSGVNHKWSREPIKEVFSHQAQNGQYGYQSFIQVGHKVIDNLNNKKADDKPQWYVDKQIVRLW